MLLAKIASPLFTTDDSCDNDSEKAFTETLSYIILNNPLVF